LKIESSFQNQNKQKRLMSKLSCFARAASHLRPRRAKRHVHARPIHPVVCCSSDFTRWPRPHRGRDQSSSQQVLGADLNCSESVWRSPGRAQ
jgi:hypothetical protein